MKPFVKPVAYLLFAWSIFSVSCKKEKVDEFIQFNHPPVANAGADKIVNIISCSEGRSVELDASGSYDPDNSLLNFGWKKIAGPSCIFSDNSSPKVLVSYLFAGHYEFELTVTDEGGPSSKGLSSKDTVIVTVTGSASPTGYDLFQNIHSTYVFKKNYLYCEDFGWYGTYCNYVDLTTFHDNFELLLLGQINFSINEYADTSETGEQHSTRMALSCNNCPPPSRYLYGPISINLKKLIQHGGGTFNGTWEITYSTAEYCDPDIYSKLAPLTVKGNLDTATHSISLFIKGKVYF